MQKLNDLSRSVTPFEPDGTMIAVIEMSLMSWLVAGIVPGVERQPLKKLGIDEGALLKLLHRWREEAQKAGHRIKRIAVAFEAGRDGFWLARWLRVRDIEVHVIHASSVAVSREHRRAKTDRLDTELLKRAFLGWLRGERDHCKMVAIPTIKDEDAKRPNRERASLVGEQSRIVNRMKATLTLAVDDPLGFAQRRQVSGEGCAIGERDMIAEELQPAGRVSGYRAMKGSTGPPHLRPQTHPHPGDQRHQIDAPRQTRAREGGTTAGELPIGLCGRSSIDARV